MIETRISYEVKDPYMGSWFPFTVVVKHEPGTKVDINCIDQFCNGAIFVEYEVSEEPISTIEQVP